MSKHQRELEQAIYEAQRDAQAARDNDRLTDTLGTLGGLILLPIFLPFLLLIIATLPPGLVWFVILFVIVGKLGSILGGLVGGLVVLGYTFLGIHSIRTRQAFLWIIPSNRRGWLGWVFKFLILVHFLLPWGMLIFVLVYVLPKMTNVH
jgi:hypothetical protein